MEYGVKCVTDFNIGVLKMPELYAANWDFQNTVNTKQKSVLLPCVVFFMFRCICLK